MLQFISEQTQAFGFNQNQSSKIEVAIEEALVNIISYGYPSRSGSIEIECSEFEKSGFKITLKDSGIPYNPLALFKSFDPNAPLEIRSIGGFGVHLIREIMDKVDYQHEQNRNILTLIKYKS